MTYLVMFIIADLADESNEGLDGSSLSEALGVATLPTFVLFSAGPGRGRELARAAGAARGAIERRAR